MSTITCNNCGYDENPSGAEYCEACGCELNDSLSSPTTTTPTIDATPVAPPPATAPPVMNTPVAQTPSSPVTQPPVAQPQETVMPPMSTVEPQAPSSPASNYIPSDVMGSAKLVSKYAEYPKAQFELPSSEHIIVGRFDDTTGPVDVDLGNFPDGDTVSRNQAEIYFDGHQWMVKPLSTTNGTYIKKAGQTRFGAALTAPENLNNGDEIAFTKIRFIFQTN